MTSNSSTSNTTSPADNLHPAIKTFMLTLTIIMIFVAVIGNALTITAVSRFKSLRYPSNMMIAALAVNDLLTSSLWTSINLVRRHVPYLFKVRLSCLSVLFVTQTLAMTTVVFQSVLSLERFYAIQFPYYYHAHATAGKNVACNIIIAAVIIALGFPVFFGIDNWSHSVTCYAPSLFPTWYTRIIVGTPLIFLVLGLFAFFRIVYAEIKFRLRDRIRVASEDEKQASLQSTLAVVAYGVSMCFYLPHTLYYVWGTTTKIKKHNSIVLGIFEIVDVSNMAVNCFIYGLKNSKFREAYKCILGYKKAQVHSLDTNWANG